MTKINWYNGKTANSASDMQKLCNAIEDALNASGGEKKYRHIISLNANTISFNAIIETNFQDIFTAETLHNYLLNNGINADQNEISFPATGAYYWSGALHICRGLRPSNLGDSLLSLVSNDFILSIDEQAKTINVRQSLGASTISLSLSFTDTVSEI